MSSNHKDEQSQSGLDKLDKGNHEPMAPTHGGTKVDFNTRIPILMDLSRGGHQGAHLLAEQTHVITTDDLASTLTLVATKMSGSMQAKVLKMAQLEQQHRHQMEDKEQQSIIALREVDLRARHEANKQRQRNIFISEMLGKAFTFVIVILTLLGLGYTLFIKDYSSAGIIVGAGVFFSVILRNIVAVMSKNVTASSGGS